MEYPVEDAGVQIPWGVPDIEDLVEEFKGLMQLSHGQQPGPAAAPPMSNDGKAVDQGVAYVLMLLALLLTYLIH
ncbi:Arabinogalactan peptide 16 [Platanthera zijinensis]|uniref:Arabinogalactan peptide 16 n=1 Tax=Platanthera zijinensis TaxID=2320716 RepID=A0AAP0G415_9ASPA